MVEQETGETQAITAGVSELQSSVSSDLEDMPTLTQVGKQKLAKMMMLTAKPGLAQKMTLIV